MKDLFAKADGLEQSNDFRIGLALAYLTVDDEALRYLRARS